ncbi:ribosome maturation factor RimP [Bacillus sp. CLL-7-23]|uniref:Ribosome maturation factor RimP n=1 Tax=Bacillus changyiensis TaxID=3004103 RepID=A0ABT4X354_9BACI|nr:ribosome maturation factor RimP [Bacillus changyiensis]MDA7025822.1 ribosome maturation factor RimP [Bacillus changyiensis]
MSNKVIDTVSEMVQPILDSLQLELVDIEFVKEGQNWFLRVFVDSDSGVDIEECAKVSEALSEKLDESDPIKQNYFLEVSSPGAERPLKKEADFMKALGKNVFIKTYEPIEGYKEFEGILSEFDGEFIEVTMTIKTRQKKIKIPYEKIGKARLAVSFN